MALISRYYLLIYITEFLKICCSSCFSQCSRLPSMCVTVSTWVILLKCVHFSRTKVKVKKHTLMENTQRQGTQKMKGKNVIILILVIASRYTEVKPVASGHNERLWNSKEHNLVSFINPVLSMRYPSFWRKVVLCNFWQYQNRIFLFCKDLWISRSSGNMQQLGDTQKLLQFDGSV